MDVELLTEAGLSENELSLYKQYEKEGQARNQEALLRKYRDRILEEIHSEEKLLSKIDFIINEIKKSGRN